MISLRRGTSLLRVGLMRRCRSSQVLDNIKTIPTRGLLCQACQTYSTENSQKIHGEQLTSRGVIKVAGKDAMMFLQGLITNDMNCLDCHGCKSIYSMVLNAQGRVLYDIIIYDTSSDHNLDDFLVECDVQVTQELIKYLKKYKLRRKVTFTDVSDSHKLWSFYRSSEHASILEPDLNLKLKDSSSVVTCTTDPRLKSFGWRCITTAPVQATNQDDSDIISSYNIERFKLGIGEGVADLPPGKALPLENNLVYLRGVSFSKGCYVGQELTARTHHTGVTRKRLMPVTFENNCDVSSGTNIQKETGKSVGVIRNTLEKYGLGVIRLAEIKHELHVSTGDENKVRVVAHQPAWWPNQEASESSSA